MRLELAFFRSLLVQAGDRIAKYNAEHGGKMLFSCSDIFPVDSAGNLLDPSKLIQDMAKLGPISIHLAGYGEDSHAEAF